MSERPYALAAAFGMVLLGLSAAPPAAADAIYLCRDAKGGSVIADQPQAGLACETVTTQPPLISVSGAAAQPASLLMTAITQAPANLIPDQAQAGGAGPPMGLNDIVSLAQASQQRRSDYQEMLRRSSAGNAGSPGPTPTN